MANLAKLLQMLKSGAITAPSLSLSGTLEVDVARRFIDRMVSMSGFLSRITTRKVSRTTGALKALTVSAQSTVRVAEGSEPSSGQLVTPTRADNTYLNLPIQLFWQLLFSTIEDEQDNPNFETDLEGIYAKAFANDLARLGFRGVNDDYAGSAWTRLNKGWLQVARDSAPAGQLVNTNGMTTVKAVLDALLEATPAQFKVQGTTAFIMSQTDFESHMLALGESSASVLAQILLDGKLPQYLGYPIIPDPQIEDGKIMFSDPLNLWLTMQTEIQRTREVRGTKRCIDYMFHLPCDYGIFDPNAVSFAEDLGY